jgi:bis(5'-nucleosidyl)-tetraphosphatase
MKNEKSCGAIIFENKQKDSKVLVIQQKDGHWCFPKGHVKSKETEPETAIREILEETGLEVVLDTKFRHITSYPIGEGIEKENVYFIAYEKGGKEKIQTSELNDMFWVKPIEALGCITFDNDADILIDAMKYRKLKW